MASAVERSKELAQAMKSVSENPKHVHFLTNDDGREVAAVVSLKWREEARDALAVREMLRRPAIDKLIAFFRAIDYDADYDWPDTEAEHVYELLQRAEVLDDVLTYLEHQQHLDGGT